VVRSGPRTVFLYEIITSYSELTLSEQELHLSTLFASKVEPSRRKSVIVVSEIIYITENEEPASTRLVRYRKRIPTFSIYHPGFLGSPLPKFPDIQPAA
jgi:hypothetical protein